MKAAPLAYIKTNYPAYEKTFNDVRTSLTGVINGLVALYNTLGVSTHTAPKAA